MGLGANDDCKEERKKGKKKKTRILQGGKNYNRAEATERTCRTLQARYKRRILRFVVCDSKGTRNKTMDETPKRKKARERRERGKLGGKL